MNDASGYSHLSVDDLLHLVEHKAYTADEGFWLAKELRQRLGSAQKTAYNEGYLDAWAGDC